MLIKFLAFYKSTLLPWYPCTNTTKESIYPEVPLEVWGGAKFSTVRKGWYRSISSYTFSACKIYSLFLRKCCLLVSLYWSWMSEYAISQSALVFCWLSISTEASCSIRLKLTVRSISVNCRQRCFVFLMIKCDSCMKKGLLDRWPWKAQKYCRFDKATWVDFLFFVNRLESIPANLSERVPQRSYDTEIFEKFGTIFCISAISRLSSFRRIPKRSSWNSALTRSFDAYPAASQFQRLRDASPDGFACPLR